MSAGIGGLLPSLSTATFHGRNGRLAWASFVSDDKSGGVAAIATFSARGGGIDPINSCSDVNDFGDLIYCEDWDRISYSPDGRRLMWDMTATAGNEVIVLANADGGALQVIDHGSTRMISSRPSLGMANRIAYVRRGRLGGADRRQQPPRRRCSRRHDDDHRLQPLSWQPVR